MKAMLLEKIVSMSETGEPLRPADVPVPEPGPGQVLIRLSACGVCHTELDEIEGRTPPPRLPVIPGHQAVGIVEEAGEGVARLKKGGRGGCILSDFLIPLQSYFRKRLFKEIL